MQYDHGRRGVDRQVRWSHFFRQFFRLDKWIVCRCFKPRSGSAACPHAGGTPPRACVHQGWNAGGGDCPDLGSARSRRVLHSRCRRRADRPLRISGCATAADEHVVPQCQQPRTKPPPLPGARWRRSPHWRQFAVPPRERWRPHAARSGWLRWTSPHLSDVQ